MLSSNHIPLVFALGFFHLSLVASDVAKPRIAVFKASESCACSTDSGSSRPIVLLLDEPKTPKEREGDRATPEGAYYILPEESEEPVPPLMGISYPGPHDADRGLKAGLISESEHKAIVEACSQRRDPSLNTKLGGEIFVHGRGSASDWTLGCIALDDSDIEELIDWCLLGHRLRSFHGQGPRQRGDCCPSPGSSD